MGDISLIVLTRWAGGYSGRANSANLEKESIASQQELAKLSSNSLHIIDKKSVHNIHLEDPGLVIESIKKSCACGQGTQKIKKMN